jgi:hypothetical protein
MSNFKRFFKESLKKFHYVGNCKNSFDDETGDSLIDCFRDVSQFGQREEDFRDAVEKGEKQFLTREQFLTMAELPKELNNIKMLEFYEFEEDNFGPKVLVAYDVKKDIHYFFIE